MLLLHANNASSWTGPTGNNTYLLPGREAALIDAGVGDAAHLASLEAALAGQPLARVLLTHGHPDHASGLDAIVSRWPSADVVRFGTTRPTVNAGDIELAGLQLLLQGDWIIDGLDLVACLSQGSLQFGATRSRRRQDSNALSEDSF